MGLEIQTSLLQVLCELMHIHDFLKGDFVVGVLENVSDSSGLVSKYGSDF